jgi:single-stranded DNA-binding protein
MQHEIIVKFTGKLVKDPVLKDTRRGGKLCILRLMSFGAGRPSFIDLVALDAEAEDYADRFAKGDVVTGEGELTYSEWESKPRGRARAQKHSKHSIFIVEIDETR